MLKRSALRRLIVAALALFVLLIISVILINLAIVHHQTYGIILSIIVQEFVDNLASVAGTAAGGGLEVITLQDDMDHSKFRFLLLIGH